MKHIAIDLGGRESQICIRREDGTIVEERRILTNSLPKYLQKQKERARVVMETCSEAFAVADAALAIGHEVRVVPATLVRSLGVGSRRIKTDRRDAQILSQVSCRIDLPSVHIRTRASRELQTRCGIRDRLVQARTLWINNVRGWLRTQLIRIPTGGAKSFPTRVRKQMVKRKKSMPEFIESQLEMIEQVTQEIDRVTVELSELTQGNDLLQRLQSVPGVGMLVALRFMATIDQVERFTNAHGVESLLGLTPGEHSSSDTQRRTGITKAGPSVTRWLMVQAAWCAWRCRKEDPMVQWAKRIAERRGTSIAITALARKMSGICYALWRDGTTYRPEKGALRRTDSVEVLAA